MVKTRFDRDLIPFEKASFLVKDINIRSRDLRKEVHEGRSGATLSYDPPMQSFGPSNISDLDPIFIDALEVGAVHDGRVLYGTVSSLALPMAGIHVILRDYNDEYTVVSVYNFFETNELNKDYFLAVDSFFHLGVKVAIKNPFFKIALDGQVNIRIDDPSDLVFLSEGGNTSNAKLASINRLQGNSLYKRFRCVSAGAFYTEAIQILNTDDTLAYSLLSKGDVFSILASVLPVHEKTPYSMDLIKQASKKFKKVGLVGAADICRLIHNVDSYQMHIYTVIILVLAHIAENTIEPPKPTPLEAFSMEESEELFLSFSNRAACCLTFPDGWRKVVFDATIALAIGHAEEKVNAKALFRLMRAVQLANEPILTEALAQYGVKIYPSEASSFGLFAH